MSRIRARVLVLVVMLGCKAEASSTTTTPGGAGASAPPPTSAPPAGAKPKRDVEVLDVGGAACKVAVWAGEGMPPAEQATIDLPISLGMR